MEDSAFTCFPTETVLFLNSLKANNSRDWFQANKETYEHAIKQPSQDFCHAFSQRLLMLTGIEHEYKIYRIYRDIRFSKDKTPYNTHLRISFFPVQNTPLRPGWHFSLEPRQVVFGTGIFALEKEPLNLWRQHVAGKKGKKLNSIIADLQTENIRISEPDLKRVPKPFTPDHPRATLLRHKSISAWVDNDDPNFAARPAFPDKLTKIAQRLKPLFDYLCEIN